MRMYSKSKNNKKKQQKEKNKEGARTQEDSSGQEAKMILDYPVFS